MTKLVMPAYRPDIDGLRAVAILSVILFHINKHWVPGGFVGVDIFFVISGYLISLHIMKDIERSKFSLGVFYQRRVKRLALPLLLVVFVSMLVSWLVMLQADYQRAADSAMYALVSLANVYFWLFQDTSYFAADSHTLPLLHLWSLGVEEQFYIFWPLLLMYAYRRERSKAFFWFAGVFALSSFLFGQYWFERDASFVYYMLPARAGELLVGAMVAMAVLRGVEHRLARSLVTPLAVVGVLLIMLSLFALNESQIFPGVRAMLPTFGAALLILTGHCAHNRVSRLLAWRPMVGIGLVSYSAYLWHWPILALLHYEHIEISVIIAVLVLAVTFWWAFLSYMLVELPAREWDALPSRIFLFQYIAPSLLIVLLLLVGKHHMGLERLLQSEQDDTDIPMLVSAASAVAGSAVMAPPVAKVVVAEQGKQPFQTMSEIDTGLHDRPRPAYEYGNVCQPDIVTVADMHAERCVQKDTKGSAPRVLLWGDSNAAHFVGVIGTIAQSADFSFRNIAAYSCPPLQGDVSAYVAAKRVPGCQRSVVPILAEMNAYDVVIIAAAWPEYAAHTQLFYDDLFATIKALTKQGKLVLIMAKVPVIASFDIDCKAKASRALVPMQCVVKEGPAAEVTAANTKLSEFARSTDNVAYYDISRYLCKDGKCSAYDAAENPLYFDTGHLSMPGSWKIGESIVRQEGVPEPFLRIKSWLDMKAEK